jgi:hypothetical protein
MDQGDRWRTCCTPLGLIKLNNSKGLDIHETSICMDVGRVVGDVHSTDHGRPLLAEEEGS